MNRQIATVAASQTQEQVPGLKKDDAVPSAGDGDPRLLPEFVDEVRSLAWGPRTSVRTVSFGPPSRFRRQLGATRELTQWIVGGNKVFGAKH
jgi:hypothetical protein